MSHDTPNDFFAPPPFKADQALVGLQRQLRELRLTERAGKFEFQGQALVSVALSSDGSHIACEHAHRGGRGTRWEARALRSAGDVRKLLDDVKRQLSRSRDDD